MATVKWGNFPLCLAGWEDLPHSTSWRSVEVKQVRFGCVCGCKVKGTVEGTGEGSTFH